MININVQTKEQPLLSNEIIYKRLTDQTPLDFAVGYLEQIEDLFEFYSKFNMTEYDDFYVSEKYRVLNEMNAMRLNGFEGATKGDTSLYVKDRARIWKTETDLREFANNEIRIYI